MKRRRLALEEDEESQDELAVLLPQMAAVLQFNNPEGGWHARRKNSEAYGHGATAAEAMRNALAAK